jgi:hypothetical protein
MPSRKRIAFDCAQGEKQRQHAKQQERELHSRHVINGDIWNPHQRHNQQQRHERDVAAPYDPATLTAFQSAPVKESIEERKAYAFMTFTARGSIGVALPGAP